MSNHKTKAYNRRTRKGFRGSLEPLPHFSISHENEIIWSHEIFFLFKKLDKISKANPHTFIYTNPLSRNPGPAPVSKLLLLLPPLKSKYFQKKNPCYHALQTNTWHREEESQNNDTRKTKQSKATSSLSDPGQDGRKSRKDTKHCTTKHGTNTDPPTHTHILQWEPQ